MGLDPNSCGMICGPENFGAQKPAPRPFLKIAEALRRKPAETLVIGDKDNTDGEGAAAAGMMYIKIAALKKDGAESHALSWEQFCALIKEKAANITS
jgi:FMN phosphatase YigB (HAD superfamily)